MYDNRRHEMRVINWMALVVCWGLLVLLAFPSIGIGELAAYYYENSSSSLARAAFMTEMAIGGAELGLIMTSSAFTGPIGWVAGAIVVGAVF